MAVLKKTLRRQAAMARQRLNAIALRRDPRLTALAAALRLHAPKKDPPLPFVKNEASRQCLAPDKISNIVPLFTKNLAPTQSEAIPRNSTSAAADSPPATLNIPPQSAVVASPTVLPASPSCFTGQFLGGKAGNDPGGELVEFPR